MTARLAMQPDDVLAGQWFHSLDKDGLPEWQGVVVGKLNDELYLVELREWSFGQQSCRRIVPLAQMVEWRFYPTDEWMRETYDRMYARRLAERADRQVAEHE